MPVGLQVRSAALVAAGGAIGSATRTGIALVIASTVFPVATFATNIVGAFGLGIVLETLFQRGVAENRGHPIRLTVGTGFFGGFTTYGALAADAAAFLTAGQVGLGLSYVVLSVVAGTLATAAGVALAAAAHHRAPPRQRS